MTQSLGEDIPRNWTKKVFAKHLIINREGHVVKIETDTSRH